MKFPFSVRSGGASLVVAVSLLLVPVRAQRPLPKPAPAPATQQTPAAEKSPAATFDTLLSADAYGIYAEIRAVGQHAGSEETAQLIAPFMLEKGSANDDLLGLYDFIKSHADELMTSRLMFATMPTRPGLPEVLLAVDMPSVEEARKFVPELRQFVAASLAPTTPRVAPVVTTTATTSATIEPANNAPRRARRRARASEENAPGATRARQPAAPPFHIKRAGSLIAMSTSNFTFKDLRGGDQSLLFNEPGFQAARAPFGADTIFVYFNTARMSASAKNQSEAREKEWRRQEQEMAEYQARQRGRRGRTNANTNADAIIEDEAADLSGSNSNMRPDGNGNFSGTLNTNTNPNVSHTTEDETPTPMPTPEGTPEATPTPKSAEELEEERLRQQSRDFVRTMAGLVFNGRGSDEAWPESIGVGASLAADALVLRGLFVSPSADAPLRPIPFIPTLLSGPAIAAEAPAVLPADTDIYASISLDLPQIYDHLTSLMKIADLAPATEEGRVGFGDQLAAFEKTNNFRIREDLLAALGNEVAIGMPASQVFGPIPQLGATDAAAAPPRPSGPIVVFALNDRESLQKLLPRVLSTIGFAGATEQNIVEKRGQVEVLSFSNGTLAFIDRFLVGTPDAVTMRRVADAYNNGETLANSEGFRDSTSWQTKQAIGQVYVSNTTLKDMFKEVTNSIADIDDPAIRAYLMQLNPDPGSITHVATRESSGLMHELRLPKNLLTLFAATEVVDSKLSIIRSNEFRAQHQLRMLAAAQNGLKMSKGRYGTLEELNTVEAISEEFHSTVVDGYEIKVSVSGDTFEATATPTGYPKLGRRSFYIDQTGTLRGGDAGGKPASASMPAIE